MGENEYLWFREGIKRPLVGELFRRTLMSVGWSKRDEVVTFAGHDVWMFRTADGTEHVVSRPDAVQPKNILSFEDMRWRGSHMHARLAAIRAENNRAAKFKHAMLRVLVNRGGWVASISFGPGYEIRGIYPNGGTGAWFSMPYISHRDARRPLEKVLLEMVVDHPDDLRVASELPAPLPAGTGARIQVIRPLKEFF